MQAAMRFHAELQFAPAPEGTAEDQRRAALEGEIREFMTAMSALMEKHQVVFIRAWEHKEGQPDGFDDEGDAPKMN